jgi:hypothetical protein
MFSQCFYPLSVRHETVAGRLSRAIGANQEFSNAPMPNSQTVEFFRSDSFSEGEIHVNVSRRLLAFRFLHALETRKIVRLEHS